MGYENPDEMRVKLGLSNEIALVVERLGLDRAAAAAGLSINGLHAIVDGRVQNTSIDEVRRVLAAVRRSRP